MLPRRTSTPNNGGAGRDTGPVGPQRSSGRTDDLVGADEFLDTTFHGLAVDGQTVTGKEFDTCTFEACSFQEAALVDCSFQEVTFRGCTLAAARLTNSRLAGVRFSGSKLTGIDWTVAHWSRVGLPIVFEAQCRLDSSVFYGLQLRHAVFQDCSARDVDFTEADLSGSNFTGTDLSGARFNHTKLTKARLEGAAGYAIDPAANDLHGTRVSLPEAASMLRAFGVVIVDAPRGDHPPG